MVDCLPISVVFLNTKVLPALPPVLSASKWTEEPDCCRARATSCRPANVKLPLFASREWTP